MKRLLLSALLLGCGTVSCTADDFKPPVRLKAGDAAIRVESPGYAAPCWADLNGDGKMQLLVGQFKKGKIRVFQHLNGGVQWAENTAGAGKLPKLKPFRELIKPGPTVEDGEPLSEKDLTGPTTSTRVWVADVDGDGKLDLLVGDTVTLITPAKGLTKAEFKKKYAAWRKAFDKAIQAQASSAATDDEAKQDKANEAFQKVYDQRSEFMKEEHTGFVWLYLRK